MSPTSQYGTPPRWRATVHCLIFPQQQGGSTPTLCRRDVPATHATNTAMLHSISGVRMVVRARCIFKSDETTTYSLCCNPRCADKSSRPPPLQAASAATPYAWLTPVATTCFAVSWGWTLITIEPCQIQGGILRDGVMPAAASRMPRYVGIIYSATSSSIDRRSTSSVYQRSTQTKPPCFQGVHTYEWEFVLCNLFCSTLRKAAMGYRERFTHERPFLIYIT